ncbi:MAG: cyclase family protein, partial [Gemmatimonadota bacterium]|nr:cyclase family protein [Gemmatimonadota bacterium]
MRSVSLVVVSLVFVVSGCRPATQETSDALAAVFSGEGAAWVDLSYAYDDRTVFWPTAKAFELDVVAAGMTEGGYYYAANDFSMAE